MSHQYLIGRINYATVADTSTIPGDSPDLCYDLDNRANMRVFGKTCFVFDLVHGRTVDVAPFDPLLSLSKKTPIVDAAVAFNFPYTHKTYILLDQSAIHVPLMENKLIPPFIVFDSGVMIHDVPKINVNDPGANDHSILFPDSGLQIQIH